ncbi:MAG TPA: DNA polymerase III subunit gamma/tau [Thermoanaerobaculia bacterium]|nr:DNA polymerase III subunit gamma/tau [Thermoanaerobaculia bacterium]
MSYQVLARKWRPQSFADLIGQEPIVTALRNALADGRIAQAYLFCGIRGVGKTTAARLLAKALNCERGPTPEPCNACPPCREITAGSDLDVLEVDAATYSKVEQVRELTESLRYGPARDRYKVVVLDEVHRLSRQAFDALLKIVEEPPPRLVFIFATTEIEAVPATILSRCQEYHFRRVPAPEVVAHLRRLCEAEGITASDTALRMIARAGEGSVRDAVALLDQLATFGAGRVAEEEAARLVGGLDTALFQRLLDGILAGRSAEVSATACRIDDEGWDPRSVYAHFLAYCRDALHLALGGDPAQMDLPREEAEALARLARGAGYENMLRLLHNLLMSEPIVRRSEIGALAAEIAWLKAAELPKLVRVEAILAGGAIQPVASVAAPTASAPAPARAAASAAPPPPPAPVPATVSPASPVPAPVASEPAAEPADDDPRVVAFRHAVARRKQAVAAYLDHAQALRFADGELSVETPRGDHILADALARGGNRQVFEEALAEVFGPAARFRLREAEPPAPPAARPERPEAAAAIANPAVQAMLQIFGGTAQVEGPPEE